MSFRLRHRANFDTQAVATALNLRTPRVQSPPQWDWAWPLHQTESETSSPPNNLIRRAWVSAVRSVAVADDATAIAFVSHDDGYLALLTRSSSGLMNCKPLQLTKTIEADPVATSVTFFNLAENVSTPVQALLAVGYKSGTVAFFDVATADLLAITRPGSGLPVRRLRFYPAFHLLTSGPAYPLVNSNGGLFAVLGWSGTLARFPATEIAALIERARASGSVITDERGGGWVVWNTSAQDAVLDATVCGSDPSSICELDVSPPAAPLRVATAGVNPPIASYSVTTDPAFSARDAAKRAASTVLSAARGFLLSRISYTPDFTTPAEEERKAVTGITRFSTSWADDATFGQPLINFGDVRDTARKSVAAVLTRGRKPMDIDGTAASESHRRVLKGSVTGMRMSAGNMRDLDSMDIERVFQMHTADIMKRQRSRFSGEQVAQAARVPQNSRIIERISAAPLPCSLFATSDTLGRVFIQDSRDLCVLRVLKGYREGQIAWLAQGGPLLVVYAPRLNVLELHKPLDVKREAAFVLDSGSMIVQSTSHHVFCIASDGTLRELAKTRKAQTGPPLSVYPVGKSRREEQAQAKEDDVTQIQTDNVSTKRDHESNLMDISKRSSADYESVGTFVEAVKRSQTSVAVDCLQKNEDDVVKVAHLMATLVTCTQYIRTEVHIALASKASEIAANLQHSDLSLRFEAHGRLAEAFGLLVAEILPEDPGVEERRLSKYGHRLLEDELGSGLVEFAVEELTQKNVTRIDGKRMRTNRDEEVMNCERFILSHELRPTTDLRAEVEYVLIPRQDLSKSEHIWLSKAYFSRLLEVDSGSAPLEGREHLTTKDVFFALLEVLELTEACFTRHFIRFFLNMPLLTILNTHAATYASPIRCAILRMQEYFSREEVDAALIEECLLTSRIPNAVLLLRLYGVYESPAQSQAKDCNLEGCLDRLEEVLLYRKLIAGSAIPSDSYEKFTAKLCTGVPGDAERQAVTSLIDWNDFDRASKILMGLDVARKRKSLEWHESASVSGAALHSCRKKSASFITETTAKVLPKSVVSWVLAVKPTEKQDAWERLIAEKRETVLREIRAVLLSAHQYFPDSSTDAVRCLQLAEAMSTLIELDAGGDAAKEILSAIQNPSSEPLTAKAKAQEPPHGDGLQPRNVGQSNTPAKLPVPVVANETLDVDGAPAVPIVLEDSLDAEMEDAELLESRRNTDSEDDRFHDARAEPTFDRSVNS